MVNLVVRIRMVTPAALVLLLVAAAFVAAQPTPPQGDPPPPRPAPVADRPAPPPSLPGTPVPPPPLEAPSTGPGTSLVPPQPTSLPPVQRFAFNIPADTPVKKLLPAAPAVKKAAGPLLGDDLAKVPEVAFEGALARDVSSPEASKHTAYTIAKINHVNAKNTDAFMKALLGERSDLSGLPFAMGDDCRTKGEQSKQFARAVAHVRLALGQSGSPRTATFQFDGPSPGGLAGTRAVTVVARRERSSAVGFWDAYRNICAEEDKDLSRLDRAHRERITLARMAALLQVLAPQSAELRLGLVKHLTGVAHVESSKALARLAIFSPEEGVREAALESLKVRRERDYTDVLVSGLRYPWPAVAKRAAVAVVKLERTDLLPQLVAVLEEADPRLPKEETVEKKRVPVVRELVRINHHRNCLLCHAPGNTGKVSPDSLSAEVPVPTDPLPSPGEGYRNSSPDLLVRVDVTYLRQDFSMLQPVADANPWPEMQRFDFLVRKRTLSEEEVAAFREKLTRREDGELSPYHRSALAALRELTGKDTEPNAAAWRKLLKLPPG